MFVVSPATISIAWKQDKVSIVYPEASISSDLTFEKAWCDRESELLEIRRYRDDWNGFGADAPDPIIIDAAIAFLKDLRQSHKSDPPFRVALSPDGAVGIEWQSAGEYYQAEIAGYDQVEWMHVRSGQLTTHWTESLKFREGRQAGTWDGEIKETVADVAVSVSVR